MTSFAQVQTAIRDGIVALNVVPAKAIAWANEQQSTAKTKVTLNMLYATAIQDRDTYTTDLDLPTQWALSTLWYIRVQIRVDSVFNAPGADAIVALERIRAGLKRPGLEWDAGLVYQPDDITYVHSVSFQHDGHTINSHSIELGFRAVTDFPLTGPEDAEPNMQTVEVLESEIEVGEDDPVEYEATVARP